jgi:hypothetical protein
MFGLFGLFGKARNQERFDDYLRAAGLHPHALDEAVKLTVLRLLKDRPEGEGLNSELRAAAALLVYCILGPKDFTEKNGAEAAAEQERRLALAEEAGEGLDALIVLLALHSGLADEGIAARFDWEAGAPGSA